MGKEMPLKPALGEQVDYFDPTLATKTGYMTGYGGRRQGPYLALVNNDLGAGLGLCLILPNTNPWCPGTSFPHRDDVQKNKEGDPTQPFWDWKDGLQKARAQKRFDAKAAS